MLASTATDTGYAWSLQPQILLGLAAAGLAYGWRFRQQRTRGGDPGAGHLRAVAFGLGLLALLVALTSPLDRLGEERLFSAHMVQHVLLVDIAPILLLAGLSPALLRPLARRLGQVGRAVGPLAHPIAALAAFVAVLWAWHVPALYELALRNPWAHDLEHLMFLGAGMAFWWHLIGPLPGRRALRGAATLGYVAAARLLLGALGVVLAFSPNAIYETYERAPRTWGLAPVEDLNVGGLVMMLEQSLVLAIFFGILLARTIDQSERAQRERERLEGAGNSRRPTGA